MGCNLWGSKSQTRLNEFTFTFHFHALEKEMTTHSSVLAWRIPGTGEPGGLPSMGSHRVGHDRSDLAAFFKLSLPCPVRTTYHSVKHSPYFLTASFLLELPPLLYRNYIYIYIYIYIYQIRDQISGSVMSDSLRPCGM